VPYRTKGTSNLLEQATPGPLFDHLGAAPPPGSPVVVLTSVGWVMEGLDLARVQDFGVGTAAVRISVLWSTGTWYGSDPVGVKAAPR
jgi:hypothetical protein